MVRGLVTRPNSRPQSRLPVFHCGYENVSIMLAPVISLSDVAYFIVRRGYVVFSWIGGSLPSCRAAMSALLLESRGLCLAAGLRLMLARRLATVVPPGEEGACLLAARSTPSPPSIALHSTSWASILALMSRAWSAILCASLHSSRSRSSSNMRPFRVRLSESSRPHSPSSDRMRNDCAELTLAISRFCRRNFFRTV